MSDDLFDTVKACINGLCGDTATHKLALAELHSNAYVWLRALFARCEAAEDENAELRKGHIPSDWLAMHANDKRLYDAARAEVKRLRKSLESAAMGLGQSRVDRIAELEERDKTLTVFANAALEHQRAADAESAAARAEVARLRDLLLDGLSHGIDDYWITTAEGVEWRERVKAALDTPEREGGPQGFDWHRATLDAQQQLEPKP